MKKHFDSSFIIVNLYHSGGLAQLARAFAWHARGHRFDSDILHRINASNYSISYLRFIFHSSVRFMEIPRKIIDLMEAGNSLEFLLAEVELLSLDQKQKDNLSWEIEEAKILYDLECERKRTANLLIY